MSGRNEQIQPAEPKFGSPQDRRQILASRTIQISRPHTSHRRIKLKVPHAQRPNPLDTPASIRQRTAGGDAGQGYRSGDRQCHAVLYAPGFHGSGPRIPLALARIHPDLPFSLPQVSPKAIDRADRIRVAFAKHYPQAHCELNYRSPHELLIATILSAQSTDSGVNKATPALFARFPAPADYAASTPAQIEVFIKSIGLFRNKARSVHESMTQLCTRFGGQVPRTMEALLTLRGVARKTANVVLGNAYGINSGFVVDTHIERLAKRLGLVPGSANVAETEKRLMALFPRDSWCSVSHQIIWHGRRACKARGGDCSHPICATFGPCGPEGVRGASCQGCVKPPTRADRGVDPATKQLAPGSRSVRLKGPAGKVQPARKSG